MGVFPRNPWLHWVNGGVNNAGSNGQWQPKDNFQAGETHKAQIAINSNARIGTRGEDLAKVGLAFAESDDAQHGVDGGDEEDE